MDISNIAIVRATNVIPFDGVVRPISNVAYLCKNINGEFQGVMSDLLRELGIIEPIDFTKIGEESYYDKMVKAASKKLKEYLPYVSDYNSCVLFSLNGICPDDSEHGFGNNTFSDKVCGIIEPLENHIDNVVSLVATDTAIKGDVYLSNEAIILIAKDKYLELSNQEKECLSKLNLTVKLFEGSLKEAIREELAKSGRYIPEVLSLSNKDNGFRPSSTSEAQKQLINNIAREYNKAQVLFFDILTGNNDELDKLDDLKDEIAKAYKVQDYYLLEFLERLLIKMEVPQNIKDKLPDYLHDRLCMQKIGQLIKEFGIENYKNFLDSYNLNLENRQKEGVLPTPNDILYAKQENLRGAR